MSQDEFSGKRKSVKRNGKRFTVDMRKELDSLITDCYGDDEEEGSDATPAALDSTPPEAQSSSTNNIHHKKETIEHIQHEITPLSQQSSQPAQELSQPAQHTTTETPTPQQDVPPSELTTTSAQPTTTPRTLVYSRSQNKITLSSLSSDGNGRSSNPIPVDANYGSNQSKPDSEKPSDDASSGQQVVNPEPVKKTRTLPDLKIDLQQVSDKKQASSSLSSLPSSPPASSLPSSPVSTSLPSSPAALSTLNVKGRQSLFFDNVATKVVRATIITTNTVTGPQGPYTVYVMEAYSESGQVLQNVSKRFKNFSELVDKLKEKAPLVASMMPHRVIVGNMTARLVSHRKAQLQALLDYILGHKELSRSLEVLAFFRNPTLLKQLASKPDMEGHLHRGFSGTLGMKYIQMWASLKSPCLYFWQSQSETAELKSAVVLRWLTVDVADEVTFTIELRPWQYLLFPSDPQSRPISIRAGSRDDMIYWTRALHAAKAAVNDIIMLKKTMLQEADATSEMDLGDDDEDIATPRQEIPKIPPLALSISSDSVTSKTAPAVAVPSQISHSMEFPASQPLVSPRRPSDPQQKVNSSVSAPSSPRTNPDSPHRNRNQTQPPAQVPPKMVTRSQTESQLSLPRKIPESTPLAPTASSSPTSPPPMRHATTVAKLKDFVEKPESQPLSRFEARMALMGGPPKYPRRTRNSLAN